MIEDLTRAAATAMGQQYDKRDKTVPPRLFVLKTLNTSCGPAI